MIRKRIFCFIFLALFLSGCFVYEARKAIDNKLARDKELQNEPFIMPKEFPVLDDAVAITRPLRGNNVTFEIKYSLGHIEEFYKTTLTSYGLYEVSELSNHTSDTYQQVFAGWPQACQLIVAAVDLAYSGANDRRIVSSRLECR